LKGTKRALLIVKLSFDVSVLLLCGLNITLSGKIIIELELDAKVLNKDFWNGLGEQS